MNHVNGLRWTLALAGIGMVTLGMVRSPATHGQEIPDTDLVVTANNDAQKTPEGTLFQAEARQVPSQRIVTDPEALDGKAVSSGRQWGQLTYVALPEGPANFKVWVRHKHGPILVKGSGSGKNKDLKWIRSNTNTWRWSDGGTFSRETIGDGIMLLRDDKNSGPEVLVDAVVLASASPPPSLPPFEPDASLAPVVVQASARWNKPVATVRPTMWGINDYEVRDPEGANNPAYQKLLSDLHPALIRIHQGNLVASWTNAETRSWDVEKIRAGMNAATGYKGAKIMVNVARWPKWLSAGPVLSVAEEDEFVKLVGDLVRVFKDMNYPVAYWEIPNEYERGYEKAGKLNDLWRLYNKMAAEIRRVDPQARVGGPALSSPETRWVEGFLKNCGQNADFLSWHNYAAGEIYTSNEAVFARPASIAKVAQATRNLVEKWVPNRKIELFLTEHNIQWVWDPIDRRHGNNIGTVFHASMIRNLSLAANGQGIDGMMMWHAKGAAYGLVVGRSTPRPPYYLFRWGTQYLSGDMAEHTTSDEANLEIMPVVRADKTRSLLLISKANRSVTIPRGATLFPRSAGQTVKVERIDAQGYSEQIEMPTEGDWTLPGYSVTMLTTAISPTTK